MREAFKKFWESTTKDATVLTNTLLVPPPPYVLELLSFEQKNQKAAEKIIEGSVDSPSLFSRILNEEETKILMGQLEKEATV